MTSILIFLSGYLGVFAIVTISPPTRADPLFRVIFFPIGWIVTVVVFWAILNAYRPGR